VGEIIRRVKGGKFIGFYLRYYEAGRRRILASKQPTVAEARRMLLQIEARIARGEAGIPERPRARLTVSELVERFLAEYTRPRLKDIEEYRAHSRSVLKKVTARIGKRWAEELTPSELGRLRDTLLKQWAAGTVRSTFVRLSSAFAWAVREGLLSQNPCRGVERPLPAQSLDFLSREEVQKLVGGAEGRASSATRSDGKILHVAVLLAVHAGLRKGELLGLRWQDLDLDQLRLTVARSYRARTKSGSARHLRLPSCVVPALRAWRALCPSSPDNLVLPIGRTQTRVGSSWAMLGLPELLRELGMREVERPWHLLRHTFASHFVMSGGNILALQKILGHSDVKMTMVYAHLAPDYLGQEMERVSFARRDHED
jgi:integrase